MANFSSKLLVKSDLAQWLRNSIYEPVPPSPLAAFRIAFATVVLLEFLHFVHRRDFVFLEFPLFQTIPDPVVGSLWQWLFAILALLVGFLTPLAAAINYLYITTYFEPHSLFSYHTDMLYVPASLLMIVLPVSRSWSIDRRLVRFIWHLDTANYPVPRLYQNILILWVMGFMYFDSTLYKLESTFWLNGLGFWLPASLPSFTMFSWNSVLNQEFLMRLAGYITLLYEGLFIFYFWIPAARIYLISIGLILHLGIGIVFPIPLFGLLMIILFVNFLPDERFDKLLTYICKPFANKSRPESDSKGWIHGNIGFLNLDILLIRVLVFATAVVLMVQACVTFELPILGLGNRDWLERRLGIARHHVFGHWQFNTMKRDVALVFYDGSGNAYWIPWIKQNGHVGLEGYGRFWSFWWLNSLPGQPRQLELWARACEAWAKQEQVNLDQGNVIVKIKPVKTDPSWESNRHRKNELAPWSDYIRLTWTNRVRHFDYLDSNHSPAGQ